MGAIKRRALRVPGLSNCLAATRAGFTGAAIDIQCLPKISRLAILVYKIAQCCTALLDRCRQYFPDRLDE